MLLNNNNYTLSLLFSLSGFVCVNGVGPVGDTPSEAADQLVCALGPIASHIMTPPQSPLARATRNFGGCRATFFSSGQTFSIRLFDWRGPLGWKGQGRHGVLLAPPLATHVAAVDMRRH